MIVLILAVYFGWFRNNAVFKERERIREEIIFAGNDWREKLKIYNEVGYQEMVLKFWKPVDSFYKDKFPNR